MAHCYPYTYTNLKTFLSDRIETDTHRLKVYRRKPLCETVAGNVCDMLVITNFEKSDEDEKEGIVLSARVHPGETSNSYAMEGIIEFLTGNTEQAKYLRNKFIFKIVPMLNIDGVVCGHYRCNLSGVDLNR
jgi:murein tripeptide amidase MpaA